LGKLRLFAELLAKLVAARHAIEILSGESFDTVLRLLRDQGLLPRQPAELFHYLRRVGNAAVHDNVGTPAEALTALKLARQLGVWYVRSYGQGFRSCIGIIGLVKRFGVERVDAACARALVLGTRSYSSVAAILKNHREHTPTTTAEAPILIHENIRGPGYYH
jgi:Domain of unknown function (DUF4145)